MKTIKTLRKLLRSWAVSPPRDPEFQAAVWRRIRRLRSQRHAQVEISEGTDYDGAFK